MEFRTFGATGMKVSALGFGGSEIGYGGSDVSTVERLLGSALDAGLNVIDTAACYMDSEEKIGQAVGHRRSEYLLFTKCGHASGLPYPDWDPELVTASIDRSLKRLRTDHLDLIQLHSCSRETLEQGDVIHALQRARDAGKVRFIGYSGDREAARYAVTCGAFDALQTSVNIADQEAIDLTIALAEKRQMGVIAKRPVANVAWLAEVEPSKEAYSHAYWERLQELRYDFLSHSASDSVGRALRFTLTIPGVHTAIVGTQSPDRWQQNADLLAPGALDANDFNAIRTRFREVAKPDWTGQT
ncbi:MAG: aldo/keto reductase [Firmicutes bacterium]|nr:aldo/keto reductase [Bacillota bacterium]